MAPLPRRPEAAEHDVALPDGTAAFIDGGPRQPLPVAVVHRETVERGSLTVDRYRPPSADLAPDQLAAVAHEAGAARIIAPAGSGKTRVLTERLRHLLVDRAIDPATITAVAYNTRAADELKARTGGLPAQIRTIHALGYSLLREAAAREGRPIPRVLKEREVRSIIEKLVPERPIANTYVAPYLEALAAVRVSLRSPEEVERSRDDVPGFANAVAARQLTGADAGRFAVFMGELGALRRLASAPAATTRSPLRHVRDRLGLGAILATLDHSRSEVDRSSHGDDLAALLQVAALHEDPTGFEATALQPAKRAAPEPPPQVDAAATRVPARIGLRLVARGGYPGRIVALGAQVATVDALGAPRLAVRYGTEVVIDGKTRVLTAPVVEDEAPADPALIEILRSWRARRAREDRVPDDVVMNDEQLDGIARRKPRSLGDLAGCPGMGPTRLTRYGDEILLATEEAASP